MARGRGDRETPGSAPAGGLPEWAREMVLLGCHGGAGTSTLRVLLSTPWELGAYTADRSEIATFGRPLVLVTRDSAAAANRAAEVVAQVATGGAHVAALAVVADGSGPEARAATALLHGMRERVGRLVRVPFVAGLRQVDAAAADQVRLPKKAQQALAEIKEACERAASTAPA